MATSQVAPWASVAADAAEVALLVALEASVAALAALGLQLTQDGAAFSVVLELGARGVLEGLAGL